MVASHPICIKAVSAEDKDIIDNFLKSAGTSLRHFRYFDKRPLDVLKNHVITCVLFENEQPIGYGHLDNDTGKVWLGIAISENFKGKGYGLMVMDFLILKAKENNISLISLAVDLDNEAAINLYKKVGFKIVDKINEKAYLMQYKNY